MSSFNWKDNCLLCGKKAEVDVRHLERNKIHNVTTLSIHTNLLECSNKRGDALTEMFVWLLGLSYSRSNYHANWY